MKAEVNRDRSFRTDDYNRKSHVWRFHCTTVELRRGLFFYRSSKSTNPYKVKSNWAKAIAVELDNSTALPTSLNRPPTLRQSRLSWSQVSDGLRPMQTPLRCSGRFRKSGVFATPDLTTPVLTVTVRSPNRNRGGDRLPHCSDSGASWPGPLFVSCFLWRVSGGPYPWKAFSRLRCVRPWAAGWTGLDRGRCVFLLALGAGTACVRAHTFRTLLALQAGTCTHVSYVCVCMLTRQIRCITAQAGLRCRALRLSGCPSVTTSVKEYTVSGGGRSQGNERWSSGLAARDDSFRFLACACFLGAWQEPLSRAIRDPASLHLLPPH